MLGQRVDPRRIGLGLIAAMLLAGCALTPRGAKEEKSKLEAAGVPFEPPMAQRELPEIPEKPDWRDVLHRAFLANGELEAAYFEWKAAFTRIDQAASYPNSNIELGFEYMFSSENMKAFDRTTITAGFDPMENLAFPSKVAQAGKVALQEARAAGERFAAAKFQLQQDVLMNWYDYALLAEKVRIQRQTITLLRLMVEATTAQVQTGAPQQDLLQAGIEVDLAENELRNLEAEMGASRAMLNARLAQQPDAALAPPAALPESRLIPADDAQLLTLAVDKNPELAALAHDVAGRTDALELARMQYLPDINPMAGFTGTISQFLGAGIVLPTNLAEIRGAIQEAQAMLRSAEATLRQRQFDRAGGFVAALVALRNNERQAELLELQILPASQRIVDNATQSYATGTLRFSELLQTQRMVLEIRQMLAEARMSREKRLVEMEALMGRDIETVNSQPDLAPIQTADAAATVAAVEVKQDE